MSKILNDLIQRPAPDMPAPFVQSVKKEIERGAASFLSAENEKGPFMLYLMGSNYQEIAETCGWPPTTIVLTALRNKWYEKKKTLELVEEKDGAKHVFKETLNALLATTSAVVLRQLQQIMRGEMDAKDCKFIPKDIYGMEKLLGLVGQIHRFQEKSEGDRIQNINVQVANMPGNHGASVSVSASGDGVEALPAPQQHLTLDQYSAMPREERLKLLAQQPPSGKHN